MKWFEISLKDAVNTSEWLALVKEIKDFIYADGTATNIHGMSENELSLLIERITKHINSGSTYQAMSARLNQLLNYNLHHSMENRISLKQSTAYLHNKFHQENPLNHQLWDQEIYTRSLQSDSSTIYLSKSDYMTAEVNEALIHLLGNHTELVNRISSRFLNQSFQNSNFRRRIWSIVLISRCKSKRNALKQMIQSFIPDRDEHNKLGCSNFLESSPSMSSLKDSVGCLYAMNYLLKFYQASLNTSDNLKPYCVKLVAVLVLAMKDHLPRNQPPNTETICLLVQELFVFLSITPSFITHLPPIWFTRYSLYKMEDEKNNEIFSNLSENKDIKKIAFSQSVLKHLRTIDSNIADSVMNELLLIENIGPISELCSEDEIYSELFYEFIQPVTESIFSGYLSESTLLYVWDQLILCIAGAEPVETSVTHTLSCFVSAFVYLCWIRIHKKEESSSDQLQLHKEQTNKGIETKGISALHEYFSMIGPRLHENDFQFL
nr:unnamed protein product [Trichobilharzia regenti]